MGRITLVEGDITAQGVDAIVTFGLDTFSPIVNANANTGDGNGMDIEGGGGFAFGLVINFDTPVNSDGFVFTADVFGNSAQGVGLNSITFDVIPEPASTALVGLGGLCLLGRWPRRDLS